MQIVKLPNHSQAVHDSGDPDEYVHELMASSENIKPSWIPLFREFEGISGCPNGVKQQSQQHPLQRNSLVLNFIAILCQAMSNRNEG